MGVAFTNKVGCRAHLSDVFPECRKGERFGEYSVYLHHDNEGNIFYVGKGTKRRPYNVSTRSKEWKSIAKEGYTVSILFDGLSNAIAEKVEQIVILFIGIDNLVNKTLGGGGAIGFKHSREWKIKLRDRMSGIGNPMHGKQAHNKGIRHTDDAIEKMRGPRPSISGDNNPSSDKGIYIFSSVTGDYFVGTRSQMSKHSGLTTRDLSKIITGGRQKSKGWSVINGEPQPVP